MILMMPFQREKLLGMAELLFPTPGEEKRRRRRRRRGGGGGGRRRASLRSARARSLGSGRPGVTGAAWGERRRGGGGVAGSADDSKMEIYILKLGHQRSYTDTIVGIPSDWRDTGS